MNLAKLLGLCKYDRFPRQLFILGSLPTQSDQSMGVASSKYCIPIDFETRRGEE